VAPWAGQDDRDFHGSLAAIWVWARYQALSGDGRFSPNREAAWSFVQNAWRDFIPEAIGPEAGDEAVYDCALLLRAAVAERGLAGESRLPRPDLIEGGRALAGLLSGRSRRSLGPRLSRSGIRGLEPHRLCARTWKIAVCSRRVGDSSSAPSE
jgi:hypothetical protein